MAMTSDSHSIVPRFVPNESRNRAAQRPRHEPRRTLPPRQMRIRRAAFSMIARELESQNSCPSFFVKGDPMFLHSGG